MIYTRKRTVDITAALNKAQRSSLGDLSRSEQQLGLPTHQKTAIATPNRAVSRLTCTPFGGRSFNSHASRRTTLHKALSFLRAGRVRSFQQRDEQNGEKYHDEGGYHDTEGH